MSKVVIVTGASRGIGREIAIMCAKEGYQVIANYNHSEEQAKELEKQYSNISIFQADVSKTENCENLIKYTIEKYKKIDVLINNAGISEFKLFTEITDDDFKKIIDTNLYSAFIMCQETVPYMIHEKDGCIINISSIWGMVGASCEVAYSISKAGMDGMTKSLAKELGPSNIRVNSIAPGIIDTDINNGLTDKEKEDIKEEIPLGKIGKTTEIAKCVKWLIEDEYTTGQIISINGGWIIT